MKLRLLKNAGRALLILLLVFLSFSFTLLAREADTASGKKQPRKKVAVLNFTANNTDEDTARIARSAVELALFRTGFYDLLEKEHINLIVEERRKQKDECRSSDCAAAIGELLSAGYVVVGSVEKGNTYVIQAKVVDVGQRRVVIAETAEAADSAKVRQAADRMSRKISRKMERLDIKGRPVVFSAAFNFVAPLDYLARKVGPGFGFTLTCVAEDLIVRGLQAGGSARFIYYTGKPHESHHAMMVPVNAQLGYRFSIGDFSINPYFGAGGSYNIVYFYRDRESSEYSGSGAFQPFLLFGLDLTYGFTSMFQLQLKPEYAMIFEPDGIIQFFSAGIGVGIVF